MFVRQAFVFHGMPGKFIWMQNVNAYAIFKQYFDSLIPALYVDILFIQNICFICGRATFLLKTDFNFIFVKVILGIPKLENL